MWSKLYIKQAKLKERLKLMDLLEQVNSSYFNYQVEKSLSLM